MAELHTLYRPESFDEIVGNKNLKSLIKEKIANKDFPRSIILSGGAGRGKTTLARLIAKELGCISKNIIERNIANETGVDDMRRLLESLRFAPLVKKGSPSIRVFILDEFHRATGNAQDCILKPLEQPDKSTYFIICTTEPGKVIKTIKSRCTQWEVSALDYDEMKTLLEWVADSEEKKVAKEVIEKIIEVAEGTPRNALKLLDSVIDVKKVGKALELIIPVAEQPETIELCRILIRCEKGMWPKVAKILREIKIEPEKIRLAVLGYLTSVMIKDVKKAPMIFMMADELKEPLHYNGASGLRMQLFAICSLFEN